MYLVTPTPIVFHSGTSRFSRRPDESKARQPTLETPLEPPVDGNRRFGNPLDAAAPKRFPGFIRNSPAARLTASGKWITGSSLVEGGVAARVPPNRCLLFLGLNLDDEVYVVPDSTQIGLHAEIRALEGTPGGKTSRVSLVEGILTDFVYDDVECNWFGHAM